MSEDRLPLAGIRVLDLATVLAAPVTATMLGDFGAEVVKVEEPGRGDFTRGGPGSSAPGRRSLQWIQEGRNKKSVTVDLHTARGQELVRELVPHFDVVVMNFRPPTLEKWDLTPERLQEINPRAVLVVVTGYGMSGPFSDRGAFDRIASAFSGLTYVSGEPDGPPTRTGYAVIDYMAAYLAAFATVTALYDRDRNGGTGQIVDLGLYEAGFRASENALLSYAALGAVRERQGNRNLQIVPASDFDTADGRRISVHAGTDALFGKLAAVMGMPRLAADPRFATRECRVDNQDELYAVIAAWAGRLPADDAVRILNDAGVPASPIMSIADIAADPHYRERGTITTVADDDWGDLPMVAPLPRLSATPGRIRSLGPRLGEHTDSVLIDLLGLDQHAVDALRADGVV
ncbi:CoA transferase [Saccharopolyspora indica]|uniref:CaiB/BaiF CoA transferase family protein n=1 Tax=Saccharopolyspora indica TaxID=1229659 RepID=UPI0022EAF13A|nr:CoA transferase [Saccharopolyspora indica]MDA3646888.1 CoA transferase [Saccharopolyspora indica]